MATTNAQIGQYFTLGEFASASEAPLTAAEVEAAKWWANMLDKVRAHFGRPLTINSFVRIRENRGPDVGGAEHGPHGRDHQPGNAVDWSVSGISSREALKVVDALYPGTSPIWAKLDGGNHVHCTRYAIPGSVGGAGAEYTKADGTTGVNPIAGLTPLTSASGGAGSAPGKTPAGKTPTPGNPATDPPGTIPDGHFPWGTVALIAATLVAAFLAVRYLRR